MKFFTGVSLAGTALAAAMLLGGCNKAPIPSAPMPAVSAPAAPAANVSDADVSEHVKTALLQSSALKGQDITVVTLKGDVRLIGKLDSQAQINEALRIARASEGFHTIHNELALKK